jgi:hypothetical protein
MKQNQKPIRRAAALVAANALVAVVEAAIATTIRVTHANPASRAGNNEDARTNRGGAGRRSGLKPQVDRITKNQQQRQPRLRK